MSNHLTIILLAASLVSCSCPTSQLLHNPYRAQLLAVTRHKVPPCKEWKKTPKQTPVWTPPAQDTEAFRTLVDTKVGELSACLVKASHLMEPIRRRSFGVMVAPDWYKSTCTEEQMIPSWTPYSLCEQKKMPDGSPVKIPVVCRGLTHPSKVCPCPCNFRVAVLRSNIIVVTPNLKLFKSELARVVLFPKHNNPWTDKTVAACVSP